MTTQSHSAPPSATSRKSLSETVNVLNHLLVLCADGVEGYRHAAAAVDDPRVHQVLAKSAAEREEIASVLTNKLVALGCKPDHHGSLPGAIHRRWLDAIAFARPGVMEVILAECARGEHETIVAFASALGRDLPADAHAIVQELLGRVLAASASLRALTAEQPARAASS